MKHDVNRLPKWAQDRIQVLEHNLKDAEAKLTQLHSGEPTRISQGYGSRWKPARWLLEEHVTFHLTDESWIQVRLEGDRLKVFGSGSFSVLPWVTNALDLQVVER
jgi:hypothetical protein